MWRKRISLVENRKANKGGNRKGFKDKGAKKSKEAIEFVRTKGFIRERLFERGKIEKFQGKGFGGRMGQWR